MPPSTISLTNCEEARKTGDSILRSPSAGMIQALLFFALSISNRTFRSATVPITLLSADNYVQLTSIEAHKFANLISGASSEPIVIESNSTFDRVKDVLRPGDIFSSLISFVDQVPAAFHTQRQEISLISAVPP